MFSDATKLPDNPADLKGIINNLNQEYSSHFNKYQQDINAYQNDLKAKEFHIKYLEEKVRHLENKLWGRKTEKLPVVEDNGKKQGFLDLPIFNEAEDIVISPSEEKEITVPEHNRKKSGRKPIPDHLPRIDKIHDITEEEKVCACGCEMNRIGQEVSEKLDVIPAKIQVIRNIRYKYACPSCEGAESEEGAVKIAPPAPQLIEKGILSERLLANIITAKFVDALPFYRQEKIFDRMEVDLNRATMAISVIKAAQKCKPIILLLYKSLLSGTLTGIDETPIQVMNEINRANTTKSYMWVFRGGAKEKPVVLFQYRTTRSGEFLIKMFSGYKGYIQSDGYCGYDTLELVPDLNKKLLGCWTHARRKFFDVIEANKKQDKKEKGSGNTAIIIGMIKKLYAIEKQIREENMTVEQTYSIRQEKAKPVLNEIKEVLDKIQFSVPPKSLLGKAIGYTLPRWNKLILYIEDGRLTIDNNLVENAIRPFAIGRKNWLFSGHPRGAETSGDLYSLIETAKANGLEPSEYLHYIFEKIPLIKNEEEYINLLPQNIDPDKMKNFLKG